PLRPPGPDDGRRDLPRLSRPPDAALPAALAADRRARPEGHALVDDPRLPLVYDPVRDVAADGVLQDDSPGARGRRARRRLLAPARAAARRFPDLPAGDPDRRDLRVLAVRERVHLRVHLHAVDRRADALRRSAERADPRRRLLLAVADGGGADPEHPARAALQLVPRPLHQGIHGWCLPLRHRAERREEWRTRRRG